tara:strand:+ start:604 stop:816 length:213 start_codon:yes stop_codon:yes gene_type:complete
MKTYTVEKTIYRYEVWNAKIEANSEDEAVKLIQKGKGDWRYTCNLDQDQEITNVEELEVNTKEKEVNNND